MKKQVKTRTPKEILNNLYKERISDLKLNLEYYEKRKKEDEQELKFLEELAKSNESK